MQTKEPAGGKICHDKKIARTSNLQSDTVVKKQEVIDYSDYRNNHFKRPAPLTLSNPQEIENSDSTLTLSLAAAAKQHNLVAKPDVESDNLAGFAGPNGSETNNNDHTENIDSSSFNATFKPAQSVNDGNMCVSFMPSNQLDTPEVKHNDAKNDLNFDMSFGGQRVMADTKLSNFGSTIIKDSVETQDETQDVNNNGQDEFMFDKGKINEEE